MHTLKLVSLHFIILHYRDTMLHVIEMDLIRHILVFATHDNFVKLHFLYLNPPLYMFLHLEPPPIISGFAWPSIGPGSEPLGILNRGARG